MLYVALFSIYLFFFLMIRRPPRSTLDRSSAASDVYKRQAVAIILGAAVGGVAGGLIGHYMDEQAAKIAADLELSLIHISEPTRPY